LAKELNPKLKHKIRRNLFSIAFFFLLAFSPVFISSDFYLTVLIYLGINIILVTGLILLMGYAGQISLGHAALYGVGAYTSAYLSTRLNLSFWLALPLAGLSAALIAFFLGLPSLRLKGHYLAMATLGFGEIAYIFFNEAAGITGGVNGFIGIPSPSLFFLDFSSPRVYYELVLFLVFLSLILAKFIVRGHQGRSLRALHAGEVAAESVGINTALNKLFIFSLSGFLAGLAGSLYAHYTCFISPSSFSLSFSILLVAMAVVGGLKYLSGGVLGALFLTILSEFFRAYQDYSLVLLGLTLIMVVVYFPDGLSFLFNQFLNKSGGKDKKCRYFEWRS